MSSLSLDEIIGDVKSPLNQEGDENPDSQEQELSFTEKKLGEKAKDYIGCRNVTAKKRVERGIQYSIPTGDGQVVLIKPGDAIAVPKKLWNQVKETRTVYGELAFEECDLKYCDGDIKSFKNVDTKATQDIDEALIETIFLAVKNDVKDEVIELLSTCNSVATLQHIMREFESSSKLDQETKTEFSKHLIRRISALRKLES